MRHVDFEAHNADVEAVWRAYEQGVPTRAPMILGINVRYTMWRPDVNPDNISFEEYFADPDKMLQRQLEHQDWARRHVPQDAMMGAPPDEGSEYLGKPIHNNLPPDVGLDALWAFYDAVREFAVYDSQEMAPCS